MTNTLHNYPVKRTVFVTWGVFVTQGNCEAHLSFGKRDVTNSPQVKLHRIIAKLICDFVSQIILNLGPLLECVWAMLRGGVWDKKKNCSKLSGDSRGGILHHRREVLVITRQLKAAEVRSKLSTMNDKSSFVKVPLVITKQLVITKELKLYF
jgi:hypothetical protein